jgi:hypothetical protein
MAALFDFDRDGDLDVLGTAGKGSSPSATFVWAENKGNGDFTIRNNIAAGQGDFLQGIAIGRLMGPNSTDIALSWHGGDSGIQLISVPPDATESPWSWRKISTDSQDEQLSAGLIDDDESVDLLMGTKWLSNRGSMWEVHVLYQPTGDPDRNRLFDMNRDGKLDAVVGYEAINRPGKLAWYARPADPLTRWTEHNIAEVVGPMSIDVADMDLDGDPDVVVGEHNYEHPEAARMLLFENVDGQATKWSQHLVHTGDEHHDGAVLIDIENDGDLDIISIGWLEPEVLLYENLAVK